MKTFNAICIITAVIGAHALEGAESPIGKVLDMLADLEAKVSKDASAETLAYENYTKFCVKSKRDLGYEITDGETNVEELQATIEKSTSEADGAAKRLEELAGIIGKNQQDLEDATAIRKKEKAEHEKVVTEMMDSSDMLGKAMKILGEKLKGSSLLQADVQNMGFVKALGAVVDAASMEHEDKDKLMALVESSAMQPAAPDAYQSHSVGIIQTLEDMKQQALSQIDTAQKEETEAAHNFNMLQQSLQMQIKSDEKEVKFHKGVKSEAEEELATAKGDLDGASKDLADDKASLEHLTASCEQADTDYAASKKGHEGELEALAKAEEVLKEKTGSAVDQTYKSAMLLQTDHHHRKAVLLQLDNRLSTPEDLHGFEAAQIVRNLAKQSKSAGLMQLAANVESLVQAGQKSNSGEDVFKKVKELISGMIEKRKEQALKEETKKAYCEEETAKTKEKVADLTDSKDTFVAKVEKKESQATSLKSESDKLLKELSDMAEDEAEMTATRKEESKNFAAAKEDLEAGLEGVRMALSVLRDYYEGTGVSESLIQQPQFGHSKQSGASTGIIGMLEVVESDFGRNLAEAETVEAAKEEDYTKMIDENKVTKIQKTADQKYKEKTSTAIFKAVKDVISDKEAAQEELDAVLKYQESLAQECLDGAQSYEERVKQREEEIAGLKDALVALGGADLAFVQMQMMTTSSMRWKRQASIQNRFNRRQASIHKRSISKPEVATHATHPQSHSQMRHRQMTQQINPTFRYAMFLAQRSKELHNAPRPKKHILAQRSKGLRGTRKHFR